MKTRRIILAIAFVITGSFCFAQGQSTAEEDAHKGTDSRIARGYYKEAVEMALTGNYKSAAKQYLKAIKEDPNYVEAYDNLGLAYKRLEDYKKSIIYFNKSIALYPKGKTAHQNLAEVYYALEDFQNVIKEYTTLTEIFPDDPEGFYQLSNGYLQLSDYDEALVHGKKALEMFEATESHRIKNGYYLIGLIYYVKKDNEEAKKYIKIAKDKGVNIHSQVEYDLFGEGSKVKKEYNLKTKEDYVKYEPEFIETFNWIMKTPLGADPEMRKEKNSFLTLWMVGVPYVTIDVNDKIVTYIECGDCLIIYMSGWAKSAIESKDYKNKELGSLGGTLAVIKFYLANKDKMGENEEIEKLIVLKNENKLEEFIKKNI